MPKSNYTAGNKYDEVFLLKKFDVKAAKNGKPYADMLLANRREEIPAKKWDVSDAEAEELKAGMFVKVNVAADNYNNMTQFIVNSIKRIEPTDEEIGLLIDAAPYPPEKMYGKIASIIEELKNEDIKKITLALLEDHREKLLYYPAAKNFHHAQRGGLLYHMYTMMRCASAMLDIYDFLSKDLVYAGIALHDITKVREFDSDKNGTVSDYTAEGKLLGHIVLTICDIENKSRELGCGGEAAMLLKHMVLSHHELPEFGSPKPPMFAEAELLHYIDELDSRMNQFQKTTNNMKKKEFAENVWILDKRTVYNHMIDKTEEDI